MAKLHPSLSCPSLNTAECPYISCDASTQPYPFRVTDQTVLVTTDVNPAKKTPFGSDEFGIAGGWTAFKSKDSDAFESILRKIDEAQLQVRQLRTRMDKVVREHAGKFTSNGSSFAHDDPSANCAPNSVLPHVNIEKTPFTSVCTTSQHGPVTPGPDMVESTEQPRIEGKCEKVSFS